jgi:hypothetical protein
MYMKGGRKPWRAKMSNLGLGASKVLPVSGNQSLVCRLRQKQAHGGQLSSSPTAGEVELQNISAALVEIEWQINPLQYLNLLVTDFQGNQVSESHYGDLFSPLEEPSILRLKSGEKYVANVSLLGNVPEEKQIPGCYVVQAVFDYHNIHVHSEPIQIQIKNK